MAAIRFSQVALGMSEWPCLSYMVRGFKKRDSGSRARIRLPITPNILRIEVSMGKKGGLKRCLHVLSSFLPVFRWLFADEGSCCTI